MNKIIETERLILRKPRLSDAEAMFNNWASDTEVTKFLSWNPHGSVEVTKKLLSIWTKEAEDPNVFRFFITIKGSDEPWGSIDVVKIHDGAPEIGYCLSSKKWNKGYMTEACKALIDYLFSLGYKKVTIRANEDNIGSNRVIQKCGLKLTHKEHEDKVSESKPFPAVINNYEISK